MATDCALVNRNVGYFITQLGDLIESELQNRKDSCAKESMAMYFYAFAGSFNCGVDIFSISICAASIYRSLPLRTVL